MPYYPTIEEDLARAKEILAKGKANTEDFAHDTGMNPETAAKFLGGTIYGADAFAAYKLLESFVEIIEAMDPKVIKTVLRAQKLSEGRAAGSRTDG